MYIRDERLSPHLSGIHTILPHQIKHNFPSPTYIQDGGNEVQESIAGGDQWVGHNPSGPTVAQED